MKKAKVDRLIKKFQAEGRAAGERAGAERERARWTALLPDRGQDNVVWLGPKPEHLHYVVPIMPRRSSAFPGDLRDLSYQYSRVIERMDFEAVPKAVVLTNGLSIRWMDWRPRGPYPVSELAVMR